MTGLPSELISDGELADFRALAEGTLESRARVRRKGPLQTVDGLKVPSWADVLADVPFKLAGPSGSATQYRVVRIGDTEVQAAVRVGKFPADTTGIRDADVVEITAGENAGRFVQIVESLGKDQQVALRLPVIEIQRPEGWT